MISNLFSGWTTETQALAGIAAFALLFFLVGVTTRKRAIIGLAVILVGALGFRIYLMYGNPKLETELRPFFSYFRIVIWSIGGLIFLLTIWPWIRKKLFKSDGRICKDWKNEKDLVERFRKRLAYETYAVRLENIKVWRRRHIYVAITAPKYPGEYRLPHDVEADLDILTLDEMVNYRQACLTDDPPCPTHIEALDKALDGGTYRGQLNLIQGPIRSGRSLSATLIAASVINNGGTVLFITAHSERHMLVKAISPLLRDSSPKVLNHQFRTFRFPANQPVRNMTEDAESSLVGITYDFVFVDNVEDLQNAKGDIPDRLMAGKVWAVSEALLQWARERGLPLWIAVQGDFATGELVQVSDNAFLTSYKEKDETAVVTLRPIALRRSALKEQDIALTLVKS